MHTERLIIKKYQPADKEGFIELLTDDAVMQHIGDGPMNIVQAEAFWKKLFDVLYPQNYKIWAVFGRESLTYYGHAGIYQRLTKKKIGNLSIFSINNGGTKDMQKKLPAE